MVYDNLKTVVDTIFVGKARQFNRRFLTLANYYLFEPVACTPESGWEKRCQALAGRKNPQQTSRTIADCFDEEQVLLNPVNAEFDGSALIITVTAYLLNGQTACYRYE